MKTIEESIYSPYKEGQWLIRRWAKENGGEADFVRFSKGINKDKFYFSKFYRIKKSKLIYTNLDPAEKRTIEYFDHRMSSQFYKAKKSEILKYANIIFNSI